MADNADIATELMERRIEAALSNRLSLYIPNPDPECEDCGQEIPQARRDAAPWATTCIECQVIREQRGRHVRQNAKGGKLARQAAMLCQDTSFQLYLDRRRRAKHNMTEFQLPDGTHNEEDARDWLCAACQIQSRAELDHKPHASGTFHAIRKRYQRWLLNQEGNL